jgi:LPS-assembly lipoprotein
MALGLVLLVLHGCGFHLRDSAPVSAHMKQVRLTSVNNYGPMMQKLGSLMAVAGVEVVDDEADAPWTLDILAERNTRRAVTTTSLITVAEYELRLEVRFRLSRKGGEVVIPPTELVAERVYVLDQTNLVGSSAEEELLKAEMEDDLVERIVRRVGAATRPEQALL